MVEILTTRTLRGILNVVEKQPILTGRRLDHVSEYFSGARAKEMDNSKIV